MGKKYFTVESFSPGYDLLATWCEDEGLLKIQSSNIEENSGLGWGYNGEGAGALTTMILKSIDNTKINEDCIPFKYERVFNFIRNLHKDVKFKLYESDILNIINS